MIVTSDSAMTTPIAVPLALQPKASGHGKPQGPANDYVRSSLLAAAHLAESGGRRGVLVGALSRRSDASDLWREGPGESPTRT